MAQGEFQVSKAGRLQAEAEIVDSVLLRPKNAGHVWTVAELGDAVFIYGVDWTDEQLEAEVKRLREEGIIEDVPEAVVAPAPAYPDALAALADAADGA